jgi:hypothetical protein
MKKIRNSVYWGVWIFNILAIFGLLLEVLNGTSTASGNLALLRLVAIMFLMTTESSNDKTKILGDK